MISKSNYDVKKKNKKEYYVIECADGVGSCEKGRIKRVGKNKLD